MYDILLETSCSLPRPAGEHRGCSGSSPLLGPGPASCGGHGAYSPGGRPLVLVYGKAQGGSSMCVYKRERVFSGGHYALAYCTAVGLLRSGTVQASLYVPLCAKTMAGTDKTEKLDIMCDGGAICSHHAREAGNAVKCGPSGVSAAKLKVADPADRRGKFSGVRLRCERRRGDLVGSEQGSVHVHTGASCLESGPASYPESIRTREETGGVRVVCAAGRTQLQGRGDMEKAQGETEADIELYSGRCGGHGAGW